uniref:Uncharacterized protein n=1 Tax=Romanomermis culicivorax TaxID=13658 RepID=A0A915IVL0_ROMCU
MDYPDALKEEIQRILLLQPTPAAPVPQIAQPAVQSPTALPPQRGCNKCHLPAIGKVTVHAMSGTLVMTTTIKKPSSLTLQSMIAANTNTTMMHRNTAPKANKRARCTQLASMKTRTSMVFTQSPPKSFEKSTESSVKGPAPATTPDRRGASHLLSNTAAAHGHIAAAYGPDVSHDNYPNSHQVTAAYGPDVGSEHYTGPTTIGYYN